MGAAGSRAGGEVEPGLVEARVREVARTSGIPEEKVGAMRHSTEGSNETSRSETTFKKS